MLSSLGINLDLSGQVFGWPQITLYGIVGLFAWWGLRRGWLTDRDIVDNLLAMSVPLGIMAAVETYGEMVGGVDISYGWRVSSLFGNPNLYAGWLLLVIPLMVAKAAGWRKSKRWVGVAYLGLLLAQLALTGSRTAMLASVLPIPIMLRNRRGCQVTLLVVVLVGAISAYARGIDASFTSRPAIYATALEQFSRCPVFGCGLDTFRWFEPGIGRLHTQAHNLILHLLAETGVVGLAVVGVGLFLVGRAVWRKGRRAPSMMQVGMTFALLAQFGMSLGDMPVRMAGVGLPTVLIAVAAMIDNPTVVRRSRAWHRTARLLAHNSGYRNIKRRVTY